jgi:hypothetical protein
MIAAAVFLYDKFWRKNPSTIVNEIAAITSTKPTHNFQCKGKVYCSEMTSYDEAVFYLQNCPGTKMDGDHDGIPCEQQF